MVMPRFTPTGVGTIGLHAGVQAASTVHPHGRGDNKMFHQRPDCGNGSPPRAWGQFDRTDDARAVTRFTPTGVGTMVRRRKQRSKATVHPHGRGDNSLLLPLVSDVIGSPPRAWGQSALRQQTQRLIRFTPTGVGTILLSYGAVTTPAVHPHGRGDNVRSVDEYNQTAGSPPRAWGQSPRRLRLLRLPRFTPTGVGTIAQSDQGNADETVHPHGRGDNDTADPFA